MRKGNPNARVPQSYTWKVTGMNDSDDLRRRYLAWVGTGFVRRHLAVIGWGGRKTPHWITDGNIPEMWRVLMEKQMRENNRPETKV